MVIASDVSFVWYRLWDHVDHAERLFLQPHLYPTFPSLFCFWASFIYLLAFVCLDSLLFVFLICTSSVYILQIIWDFDGIWMGYGKRYKF